MLINLFKKITFNESQYLFKVEALLEQILCDFPFCIVINSYLFLK